MILKIMCYDNDSEKISWPKCDCMSNMNCRQITAKVKIKLDGAKNHFSVSSSKFVTSIGENLQFILFFCCISIIKVTCNLSANMDRF